MTDELKVYPKTMSIYRENYATKADYIKDYRDLNQHYGYKVRVFGGWIFFESATDLQTWKAQS